MTSPVPETQPAQEFKIEICPSTLVADSSIIAHITAMVNHCYLVAEGDLWLPAHYPARTNPVAIADLIAAGNLVVAWSSPPGAVAGCASLTSLGGDGVDGQLVGMLATARRGGGLGGRIMAFCEDEARRRAGVIGRAARCEITLWWPRGPVPHPGKARLLNWYRRLGYEVSVTLDLANTEYRHFVPLLATGLDSIVLQKNLA